MPKKTSKRNKNPIAQILASQENKYPHKTILSYEVDGSEKVDITVLSILPLESVAGIVEAITDAVFADGTYNPALYEYVYSKAILAYFTDLNLDISNDVLNEIVYSSSLVDDVIDRINKLHLADINDAIEKSIAFRQQHLLSSSRKMLEDTNFRIRREQEEIIGQMGQLISVFSEFSNGLDGYGKEQIKNDIHQIAGMDEKERISNILEFRNTQDEKAHLDGQSSWDDIR